MIKSESEYQVSVQRLKEGADFLRQQEAHLRDEGLSEEELQRAMDPARTFHAQIAEEVEHYERLKRGEFPEVRNLRGLGLLLIALRIYQGISQRELAERLGVHESQVSRDERNEYHGITVDRANRVLEALDVELTSTVTRVDSKFAAAS